MANNHRKIIPVKEGLYTAPLAADSQLIASKCDFCNEIIFPKGERCPNCQGEILKEVKLSREGTIYSFTIVMQQPGAHYKGPVPYAFGWVELPEGIRVETLYAGCKLEELKIGMEVKLVIEKLHDDEEGNEIVCHKFRPAKK